MKTTTWTRKLAFLAIVWTVALVVLLAVAEIVLRVTDDGWLQTMRLNIIRDRSYVTDASRLYGAEGARVVYHRDKYGLRDDCPQPSAIDVLTIGGSTTDQRNVTDARTYQAVMERDLAAAAGRKVCVSNAGVDGHSTFAHLMAFEKWFPLIPGLKPRVIVFYVGINDANYLVEGPTASEDRTKWGALQPLKRLEIGQVLLWAGDVVGGRLRAGPAQDHERTSKDPALYVVTRLTPGAEEKTARHAELFRQRLRRLLADARAMGAQPLCVSQPSRWVKTFDGQVRGKDREANFWGQQFPNGPLDFDYTMRRLNVVMEQECGAGHFLDLHDANFANTDFYDDTHMTPEGAEKVGTAMAAAILEKHLLE